MRQKQIQTIEFLQQGNHHSGHSSLNLSIQNSDKDISFNKLYDKLKDDQMFEDDFLSTFIDFSNTGNSSELIAQLQKILEIDSLTLIKKDPNEYNKEGNSIESDIPEMNGYDILA